MRNIEEGVDYILYDIKSMKFVKSSIVFYLSQDQYFLL